ncbi:MAG: uracil-DNA glycosylase family protein [Proteobacteria bacterium]|nr:uracil-DNA glycosylase family protein [Pseudomonadota bacterium]
MHLATLLRRIRACHLCEEHLPLGPNPVVRAGVGARLLIVGQAPGTKVHATGIPWNDASGQRLRDWLGLDRDTFYDEQRVAIVPMGFCYPGRGNGGDAPPRPECAPTWHPQILPLLSELRLIVLIGQYAHAGYLGRARKATLTQTVHAASEYLPRYLPLPHPSPRNQMWLRRNPWFEVETLPLLRARVAIALADDGATEVSAQKTTRRPASMRARKSRR